ncbi:MAG: hypothetical protein JXC36_08975 [Candidatus Atribacteria bacterium]|nr:hypothetical protein [Candidatus Atribacteria bacterium]
MIDLEMYLEQTSLPFADKLLAAVRQRKEQIANGEGVAGLPPEIAQQVTQSADPKAIEMANRFMERTGKKA